MRFEVLHTQWAAEDDVFAGGVHDDVKLTKKNAPLFAGAQAAGAIVILDVSDSEQTLLEGHVQSQEDGEHTYAAAVEAGLWQEGNLAQFELDVANGVRNDSLEPGELA